MGERLAVAGRVTVHRVGDEDIVLGAASAPESVIEDDSTASVEKDLRFHAFSAEALADDDDRRGKRATAWRCLGFAALVHPRAKVAPPDFFGQLVIVALTVACSSVIDGLAPVRMGLEG